MLSDKTVPRLSIDPFSDGFLAEPYAHHDLLRDAGPVFWLECQGIYGAARHAEVSAALKDWQNFCSGRGVGLDDFAVDKPWRPPSLLLETDPPVHDRTRSLMNSVVALPGLKALTQLWRTKAEALADRLVAQRHFAIMTGTILAKPLKGKDVISQVIRSIASCYVSQSMSGHAVDGSIETIEYDAELESGGTIHGSVIVTRRADGKVVAIDGRHSPQAAAAELAMVLRTKLGVSLTPDPRPH